MIWAIWTVPTKCKKQDGTLYAMVDMARAFTREGDLVWLVLPASHCYQDLSSDDTQHLQVLSVPFKPRVGGPIGGWAMAPVDLQEFFSATVGRYPVDAVLTTSSLAVANIKYMVNDVYDKIPVVHWETGLQDKLARWRKGPEHFYALCLAESIPVFLSQREYEVAHGLVARYCPERLREFEQRSLVAPVGLNVDRLEKIRNAYSKFEVPTVFYGGRLNYVKQARRIFEVVDMAYQSGRKLQFIVTTPGGVKGIFRRSLPRHVLDSSYLKVMVFVDRETFYRLAAGAHVGMCMSLYEGFGIAFWEMLYLEQILVVPRRPWTESVFPDWYPWFYEVKPDENLGAYAVLCEILDDLDGARERTQFPKLREWAQERLSSVSVYTRLRAHVQAIYENKPRQAWGDAEALFSEVLEDMGSEFLFSEFILRCGEVGRTFPVDAAERARARVLPSNYDVYMFLRDHGYEAVRFEGRDYVMREVAG